MCSCSTNHLPTLYKGPKSFPNWWSQNSQLTNDRHEILTGPASPVQDLVVVSATPTSITLAWDQIPCEDRNTEITHYLLKYRRASENSTASNSLQFGVTGRRLRTITGLVPRTSYQILVEASHINIDSQLYLYSPPATANAATEIPQGNVQFIMHSYNCVTGSWLHTK